MTTINLDRPGTKFISPDTEVWSRYAIELGDNGPDESHPSYWIFDALLAHGFEL